MKRSVALLLAILFMMPLTALASAQDAVRLTAAAKYDEKSGTVYVSGNLSAGEGRWITLQLLGPDQTPVYFNQIEAGGQGDFTHMLTLTDPVQGSYELRLGAVGLQQPTKAAFTVARSSDSGSTDSPPYTGSTPSSGQVQIVGNELILTAAARNETNDQGETVAVIRPTGEQLDKLLAAASGQSSLALIVDSGSSEPIQQLRMPAETLRKLAESGAVKQIVMRSSQAEFSLSSQQWTAALQQAGEGAGAGTAEIALHVQTLSGQAAETVADALAQSGSRSLGQPVEFKVAITDSSGGTRPFDGGMPGYSDTKTIRLDTQADPRHVVAVLYDPQTGSFRPVPTVVEYADEQWNAVIKHNGNGIYSIAYSDRQFDDLAEHWGRADVELLANRLVIDGVEASAFQPDGQVTRAQFAAMLIRGLDLDGAAQTAGFSDVAAADWYTKAVQAAAKAGIITGYEDGSFQPDRPISRQELAVMMQRAVRYTGADDAATPARASDYDRLTAAFGDSDRTADWAQDAMAEAIGRGWVTGRSDTQLAPDGTATRAEAAVLIKRMLLALKFMNA